MNRLPSRVLWLGPIDAAERRAIDNVDVIDLVAVDGLPDAVVVAPGASPWSIIRYFLASPSRLSRTIVFVPRPLSWQALLGRLARLVILQDRTDLRWSRRLVRHGRIAVVESPAAISRHHPEIDVEVAEMCWAPTLAHVIASNAEVLAANR